MRPRGSYVLYELYLDCLLPLERRPGEAVLEILGAHSGSSKTAKLAKELVGLSGKTVNEPPADVVAEAWSGRIEFIERLAPP